MGLLDIFRRKDKEVRVRQLAAQARSKMEGHEYEVAIKILSKALALLPGSEEVRLLRAGLYGILGEWDSAIEDYSMLIEPGGQLHIDAKMGRASAYRAKANEIRERYTRSGGRRFEHTFEELNMPLNNLMEASTPDKRMWIRTTSAIMELETAARRDTEDVLESDPNNREAGVLPQSLDGGARESLGQCKDAPTAAGGDSASFLSDESKGSDSAEAPDDQKAGRNDSGFHIQLGLTYYALGNYDRAISEYMRALQLDPCCIEAHYNLAIVYAKGREQLPDEAIRELQTVVSIDPRYHIAPLLLADLYWDQRNCEEAEKWYARALEIDHADPWELYSLYDLKEVPYLARVHHQLGVMTQNLHRAEDALFHFNEAIRIDPSYLLPRYAAGALHMSHGNHSSAIEYYRQILEIDGGFRDTRFQLGQALFAEERFSEAIPEFEAELYNNTQNKEALFMIGKCHGIRNDWKQAAEVYEKVITADPSNVEAHAFLGACYIKMKDNDRGLRYLRRAAEIDPENSLARVNLVAAYQLLGHDEEAMREIAKLTHIDNPDEVIRQAKAVGESKKQAGGPYKAWEEKKRTEYQRDLSTRSDSATTVDVLLSQSRLFYTAGKWEESIKPCEAAILIDPECAQARAYKGNALGRLERWEEAEQCYSQALRIDPSMTMTRFNRAGIYLRWKQTGLALEEYERVIEHDPDFLPAHGNVAAISVQERNIRRACEAWKEMLRIDPNNEVARYNLALYESHSGE
ncbi:MAG: tetratricopeptide repeat protein [bacterium]